MTTSRRSLTLSNTGGLHREPNAPLSPSIGIDVERLCPSDLI
jgi:hypothetical protein